MVLENSLILLSQSLNVVQEYAYGESVYLRKEYPLYDLQLDGVVGGG